MANERQQQTKKINRQKGRISTAAQKTQGRLSGIEGEVAKVNAMVQSLSNYGSATSSDRHTSPPTVSMSSINDSPASTSQVVETLDKLSLSLSVENLNTIETNRKSLDDYRSPNADVWSKAVDVKLNELIERSRSFERERVEIESLREHLKQAIETAESRLANSTSDVGVSRLQELETKLIEAQQENRKTTTLLLHARSEYLSLLEFIESESIAAENSEAKLSTIAQRVLEKTDAREMELSLEVSQLNDQLHFLQSELNDAKSRPLESLADESVLRIQVEQLRSQLLESRREAVELRVQSNDLSARLTTHPNKSLGARSETLCWEQRKVELLQQLEAESHSDTPIDPGKALEIERIIEQTTSEIERRDIEIFELKTLIEQQSIAHDGMSIGVAAIAEMIESDAMIIAERLRLKELRDDWEQKQRQAEIEMSMERAKLARERLAIQEKTQVYEDNNPPQTDEEKLIGKTRTRGRWLARLGLRDE